MTESKVINEVDFRGCTFTFTSALVRKLESELMLSWLNILATKLKTYLGKSSDCHVYHKSKWTTNALFRMQF